MILFFSGTGNSRHAAERIAEICGETLLDLTEVFRGELTPALSEEERLIIVCPTYAWRIPHLLSDWLEQAELREGAACWFVMTCGSDIGSAAEYNRQLCEKKGLRYMGTRKVVMPENYITMFTAPEEAEAKRIISRAQPVLRKAGENISAGESFEEERVGIFSRAMSAWVNKAFYPAAVSDKGYTVTDSCIGCGKCEKLCPLNNIRMENGRPVWQGNCTQCMACICRCPAEAIEYGRKTRGKRRYHLD